MDNALLVERRGALAEITLNRPAVLNALNDAMRAEILALLPQFTRSPEVYALVLKSASDRAFCAGGDVRELCALARQDPAMARASLGQEYLMNWTLECFSKPTVSLIDGIVMGSGVGLMLYGTHRVAGEGFQFAMPETAIGLFPDVGVCKVLATLPGNMGVYLGLTGRRIGRVAAYQLGLVTHCITKSQFDHVIARLEDADTVDPLLDDLHQLADDDCDTMARAGRIDEIFGQETVPGIFAALAQHAGGSGADAEWCAGVLADLKRRSPVSLVVTLRHLRECRGLDLRDVLIRDYRLAVRFVERPDLLEGVRAVVVDKDQQPKWSREAVESVTLSEVSEYFSDLGDKELYLAERSEMQDLRA